MDLTAPIIMELVFWLLLGSIEPSGLPALTADEMLDGLPASCQVLLFADVRGADTGLDALVEGWTGDELLRDLPDVATGAAYVEGRIAAIVAEAETWWGFDPFTDLHSVAFCFNLGAGSGGLPEPQATFVLRGEPAMTEGARARAATALVPVAGHDAFRDDWTRSIIYLPEPGRVIWGPIAHVETLFAAPAGLEPVAGSVNARLAELAATDVRRFAGYDPGLALSFLIAAFYPQSIAEHSANLEHGLIAANDTTIHLEARARTAEALEDYRIMIDGLGRLAMAAPIVFQGLTELLLGSVQPGDGAYSPQILHLAERRDDLLALLEASGAFQYVTLDQATNTTRLETSMTIENAAGLQRLISQLAMLGLLAAEGQLPATVESFETIPRFWGAMFFGD